jgi:hypothetical protein
MRRHGLSSNRLVPNVAAVAAGEKHGFGKTSRTQITLIAGIGTEGDAHAGVTIQHLFERAKDPTKPNHRQLHLIEQELLDDLAVRGFEVAPGDLGENITTRHLDFLGLSEKCPLAPWSDGHNPSDRLARAVHQDFTLSKGIEESGDRGA